MIEIKENVNLAPYTTFKIGGPAKFFTIIKDDETDIVEALEYARKNNLNFFILGGGSNLLVSDKGFDGLVIKIQNTKYKIQNFELECGAGVNLAELALKMARENLSGLEWSVGIPGATVGGAIRGNAEAFGVSMNKLVKEVKIFDLQKNKFRILKNEDCKFDYRESIFKKKEEYLIWSAVLKLKKEKAEIVKKLIEKSIKHRRNNYPKMASAGSVFKNAVSLAELKKHNKEVADYIIANGIVSRLGNVATGFLIDYLGLKGKKIGGAQISKKHGNFIINAGDATAEDVVMLMSLIKQKVRNNLGVQLEEEVQLVGF